MHKRISRNVSISRIFYNFLRPLMKLWFHFQFHFTVSIPPEVAALKPPFLLLPNHQGFWDPFMAGAYIKSPVFYIASDAIFRYPLFKFFMGLLGAIPKQKAQSDLESIKNILKIKNAGGNIGVFPEGQRTWNGLTLPLIFSTTKLVKLLKIPVVTALFKGGYYSHPRWGIHLQKGEVELAYSLVLIPADIKSHSPEEIQTILTNALAFDEIEYQEHKRQVFIGKNPAEHLEQVLFMCPSCHEIDSMFSVGDTFACKECGYSVVYSPYRTFTSSTHSVAFSNIRDWDRWQQKEMEKYISDFRNKKTVILSHTHLSIQTGHRERRMKNLFTGSIVLTFQFLVIKDNHGNIYKNFIVKDIAGINVQNKEKLDFYAEGVLYNIFDKKRRFSAYNWLTAIQYIQNIQETGG